MHKSVYWCSKTSFLNFDYSIIILPSLPVRNWIFSKCRMLPKCSLMWKVSLRNPTFRLVIISYFQVMHFTQKSDSTSYLVIQVKPPSIDKILKLIHMLLKIRLIHLSEKSSFLSLFSAVGYSLVTLILFKWHKIDVKLSN